jgi:hypothetical protein
MTHRVTSCIWGQWVHRGSGRETFMAIPNPPPTPKVTAVTVGYFGLVHSSLDMLMSASVGWIFSRVAVNISQRAINASNIQSSPVNCCWPSPAHLFLALSSRGLMTIFYCLTALRAFSLSILKLSLLRRHLETRHPAQIDRPLEFFKWKMI